MAKSGLVWPTDFGEHDQEVTGGFIPGLPTDTAQPIPMVF